MTKAKKTTTSTVVRILIVEDDTFMRNVLEKKIETAKNYEVYTAGNASEARSLLEHQAVDLICLDLMLPEEDGFAIIKELKAQDAYKAIPILVLSNLGQESDIKEATRLGAADFMVKANSSPADIIKRIDTLLEH